MLPPEHLDLRGRNLSPVNEVSLVSNPYDADLQLKMARNSTQVPHRFLGQTYAYRASEVFVVLGAPENYAKASK